MHPRIAKKFIKKSDNFALIPISHFLNFFNLNKISWLGDIHVLSI